MSALKQEDGRIKFGGTTGKRVALDGYAVLNVATEEVLYSGFSMPMYFPRGRALPTISGIFYLVGGNLYLLRADSNNRLLVVNTSEVGNVLWLLVCSALLWCIGFFAASAAGITFLRKFLLLTDTAPASIAEARHSGEGLTVEFKRSLSFEAPPSVDRILESITAFANTADGSIFIGIEDNGNIRGLRVEGEKARDALKERIHQAVRNRIRPHPVIQIDFLEEEGNTICRIFVPRGEQPLHVLDGVIYVRDGASDIKAPPERVLQIVQEWAV